MGAWVATHGMFLLFLACSLGSLGLSVATRQRWAAFVGLAILANQLLAQAFIDIYDDPVSLLLPMLGDCALALYLYRVYERHAPGVWSVTLFLIQFTICLVDWLVTSALTLPGVDRADVLYRYYLAANILWLLLVACNSGPGVRHVAVHLRQRLHRARSLGSLARLLRR